MEKFVKEIKKMHEEVKAALRKSQKEMKKIYRKKIVEYRIEDRMLLIIEDSM